ncbi:unnamed protein product [Mytilus edulis]|uniref:Uncharacterized protein n=1 Tax=Mytilus edulis TaxID=6550 RepID=A0A8S3VF72_MYTED|nr:unnamed protein product [Mytilus edulis]
MAATRENHLYDSCLLFFLRVKEHGCYKRESSEGAWLLQERITFVYYSFKSEEAWLLKSLSENGTTREESCSKDQYDSCFIILLRVKKSATRENHLYDSCLLFFKSEEAWLLQERITCMTVILLFFLSEGAWPLQERITCISVVYYSFRVKEHSCYKRESLSEEAWLLQERTTCTSYYYSFKSEAWLLQERNPTCSPVHLLFFLRVTCIQLLKRESLAWQFVLLFFLRSEEAWLLQENHLVKEHGCKRESLISVVYLLRVKSMAATRENHVSEEAWLLQERITCITVVYYSFKSEGHGCCKGESLSEGAWSQQERESLMTLFIILFKSEESMAARENHLYDSCKAWLLQERITCITVVYYSFKSEGAWLLQERNHLYDSLFIILLRVKEHGRCKRESLVHQLFIILFKSEEAWLLQRIRELFIILFKDKEACT